MKKQLLLVAALCCVAPNMQAAATATPPTEQTGTLQNWMNKFSGWAKSSPYLSQSMYGGGGVIVGLGLSAFFASKAAHHAKGLNAARLKLIDAPNDGKIQNAVNHHAKWRDRYYAMLGASTTTTLVGGGLLAHGMASTFLGNRAVKNALGRVNPENPTNPDTENPTTFMEQLSTPDNSRAFNFMARKGQHEQRPLWQQLLNPFYSSDEDAKKQDATYAARTVFNKPQPAAASGSAGEPAV